MHLKYLFCCATLKNKDRSGSSDGKKQLVLVGNGMAGVRAIEEILRVSKDEFEITIFGAEPHPNYNRILLSKVLQGDTDIQDITLND